MRPLPLVPLLFVCAGCVVAPRDPDPAASTGGANGVALQSCGYYKLARRVCHGDSGVHTFISFTGCREDETACERYAPTEERVDDGTCFQNESITIVPFPGSCADWAAWRAGRIDCLLPDHCAGGRLCVEHACVCPPGVTCTSPQPPPPPPPPSGGTPGGPA